MANELFKSYALLGSGRVAYHLAHYLRQLDLPFKSWSRNGNSSFNTCSAADPQERLNSVLEGTSHVLLAVSDPAINEMASFVSGRVLVHFSGSARVPEVQAAHPLMTFGSKLQPLNWYKNIPFVIDEGSSFCSLLPGLPNQHIKLAPEHRSLYHALCALAGNSAFQLWRTVAQEFHRIGLPPPILAPFLHQAVDNALSVEAQATGPVAREDWITVEKHLHSLSENPPLQVAYRGFLRQAAYAGKEIPQELFGEHY